MGYLGSQEKLEQFLVGSGAISEVDLNGAKRVLDNGEHNSHLVSGLVKLNMLSDQSMARVLSEFLVMPMALESHFPAEALQVDSVSVRFLKEYDILPLRLNRSSLLVAVADPLDGYLSRALNYATGLRIRLCVAARSQIRSALALLYSSSVTDSAGVGVGAGTGEVGEELLQSEDVEQLKDMASEAPVVRLVSQIFQRGLDRRASDIHIEPGGSKLKIRYRIDGVLQDDNSQPVALGAAVISRIKIMAKMDIAERRLPQDGRIKLRMHGEDIDVRVSTMPTLHGESAVMRLLRRESVALNFKDLGFSAQEIKQLNEILKQPNGMLLVTGPTGSGKTTTLYAALSVLNSDERKIITVEDPVEYHLAGANQIQIKSSIGLTFSNALRSIVRQDPDVIMVGEMRDLETAKICVQSALTGHLVLSTLHTNDAASTITRLLEMGVEDYLLTSTLSVVIGQRLVRVLCKSCRESYCPSTETIAQLDLAALTHGHPVTLYRARGCSECADTGYSGRVAINEFLFMSDAVRQLIVARAAASDIQRAAISQGMSTMFQDGCRKALLGVTTIEEVLRVTQEV